MNTHLTIALVACTLTISAPPSTSWALSELSNLTCIQVISAAPTAKPFGITEQDLSREVFVGVKANIPRLHIIDDCPNIFRLDAAIVDISNSNLNAVYGFIELELDREAYVQEISQRVTVQVWSAGTMLMHGTSKTIKNQVDSLVINLIKRFAEGYYKAGNP